MTSAADTSPLDAALDRAIQGDERPLYAFLCRVSGLPGVRINTGMVQAFAQACEARGKRVDALLRKMAGLHPDEAPGGNALEFVPVCATAGIGQRAATDARVRANMLGLLHDLAEDMRFRVRDAVPDALVVVGVKTGEVLLQDVMEGGWLDGYFHAAAVLRALARTEWQTELPDAAPVVECFERSFRLLDESNRSSRRYPGYKALCDAVLAAPRALAPRYGAALFAAMEPLAKTKDPDLAALIAKSVDDSALRARFGDEIDAVKRALAAAAPAPRDPTRIVKGTRGRGRR